MNEDTEVRVIATRFALDLASVWVRAEGNAPDAEALIKAATAIHGFLTAAA